MTGISVGYALHSGILQKEYNKNYTNCFMNFKEKYCKNYAKNAVFVINYELIINRKNGISYIDVFN